MKRMFPLTLLLLLSLVLHPAQTVVLAQQMKPATAAIAKPVLLWANKGCYSSWCETGWYSSPAVGDIDGDGKVEVIGSAYSIVALDGATGSLKWRVASGHDRSQPGASSVGRTWPGIGLADLDGDGQPEIITAHSDGWVSVYNGQGYFKPGWPQQVAPGSELRSLGVYDLDANGSIEIITAATRSENQWTVLEPNGSLRPGFWPQLKPGAPGYAAGAYNQNLAAGDLDGDGRAEIITPNDTHYLDAFEDDGSQVRASAFFGANKFWSQIGVHVDQAVDLRGYAHCGTEHRPNFANSAPIIVDVNNDGRLETVVIGNVYNCATNPYTDLYEIPYILNGDRTRWKAGPYDWTVLPTPQSGSAPLSEDYTLVESNAPNPAAADLDGDGNMEILYPSYDGRMHAFWLDRTEHGSWPYQVTKAGEGFIRFASEPVVADLNNDGQAEVIFASWTQIGSNHTGKLHILNAQGTPIWEVDLPPAFGGGSWNGALAAPTLADLNGDGNLEVVLNSAHSGLIAYTLPGTTNARILWGTGRGSYQRSGSLIRGSLALSRQAANNPVPVNGETITFTIRLNASGVQVNNASVRDVLPAGLTLAGNPTASAGIASGAGGIVTWNGNISPGTPVIIQYPALVNTGSAAAQFVTNTAMIKDATDGSWQIPAVIIVNGTATYLPSLQK